ncbi:hypothetical protein [Bifidobacterium callitrichidarum]|uniref:Uncharacterized protein n=1 Tax=Bifidobacterium callitrichidarum TaxID=2052941 RepID=A0A2U2N8Q7_9BIFI|nr:hypothetical protein [Bifidobacterium callitrichidarum]PWG65581.1 hypothetical protein DF196_06500 [Bifidobacterium callitrichidarum]
MFDPEQKKPSWGSRISSWVAGIGFLTFTAAIVYGLAGPIWTLLQHLSRHPAFIIGLSGFIVWMVGCIFWHYFKRKEQPTE